eukprot:TRINITY_DN434_c0_g1_i2.p1 TRINITY_DN434_c0_g1~~TRINITY_DN434_c0_g1_i2.p1  ORF type:complete len:563 (-),score=139.51 TRINITY_DN434_c0_g1_i2:870-2558(-)
MGRNRKKKNAKQPLGRLIQKDQNSRNRSGRFTQDGEFVAYHTTDDNPELESILDQGDLGQLMEYAEMSDRQFESQKMNVVVLSKSAYEAPEKADPHAIEEMEKNWNRLTIPRRPFWDENTTAEVLQQNEKESFLEWRRSLVELEENEHLILTPFEKNLNVWRQLWQVVERSQLVVQIVDARNPFLFRSIDLEEYVTESEKTNLLLVNKADYLNETQRSLWADAFNKENMKYIFFSAINEQERIDKELEIGQEVTIEMELPDDPNAILNVEQLLLRLKLECVKIGETDLSGRYVIGMVGYPNVGKSSTINAIYGQKKVAVSSTPGKTKHFQTLLLPDSDITLCDCPGLVFPTFMSTKAEMLTCGLLRIDEMRDYLSPMEIVCRKMHYRSAFEEIYGFTLPKPKSHEDATRPPTAHEVLTAHAYVRGFMASHGVPDQSRSARILLKDYVNGKLLYCYPPNGIDVDLFNPPRDEVATTSHLMDEIEQEEYVPNPIENGDYGERNPNDFHKRARGKKYQRRKKRQIKNGNTAYIQGKSGGEYNASNAMPYGMKLPTSVRITKSRRA